MNEIYLFPNDRFRVCSGTKLDTNLKGRRCWLSSRFRNSERIEVRDPTTFSICSANQTTRQTDLSHYKTKFYTSQRAQHSNIKNASGKPPTGSQAMSSQPTNRCDACVIGRRRKGVQKDAG